MTRLCRDPSGLSWVHVALVVVSGVLGVQVMRIDGRFNGPPDSAHGGVACGVFAEAADPLAANVRLMAPPPLDTDLTVETDGTVVTVSGPAGKVAEVRAVAPCDVEPFRWLGAGEVDGARNAWDQQVAVQEHPFPRCFGCGPGRPEGDGLELFAGVVPGTNMSAAWWTPDESIATDGVVDDWAVWAAVDCPSGGAVLPDLDEGQLMLLGQLSVWVHESPEVGARYQVIGRSLGRDGRRLTSEVAVVAESGEQLASGRATWIALEEHNYA